MTNNNLQNLRILITRPYEKSLALAQKIKAQQGFPIIFPTLQITEAFTTSTQQHLLTVLPHTHFLFL